MAYEEAETKMRGKEVKDGEWGDIVQIHPSGMFEIHSCPPTLKNLQALVGGYIEVVPGFNEFNKIPCIALCDEEGRLKQSSLNNRATIEWARCTKYSPTYLVGDIVILTGDAKKDFERD